MRRGKYEEGMEERLWYQVSSGYQSEKGRRCGKRGKERGEGGGRRGGRKGKERG